MSTVTTTMPAVTGSPVRRRPNRRRAAKFWTIVGLMLSATFAVLPVLWMFLSSLKPNTRILDDPPSDLLATGPVVGLLHRNEVWHAWLFRATDFCWQAVDSLERSHPYEIQAAVAFLDAVPDRSRAQSAADRLGRLVRDQRIVVLEPDRLDAYPVPAGYGPGEHHFPYDFARTPGSLARAWFTDDEMARSLDHLSGAQEEDGGWPVRWRRWAPGTALEARPMVTIEALRTLRAYGRAIG